VSDLDLIKLSDMVDVKPIGDNQKEVFSAYKKGSNQVCLKKITSKCYFRILTYPCYDSI